LADNALHIWCALASEHEPALQRYTRLLSADELQRAGRLRLPRHRERFIISTGLLRALLGKYLDCRPESIQISRTLQGKPFLPAAFSSAPITFNLSHSRDAVLFAVRLREPVGIDVEYMRDNLDFIALAERFLSVQEYRTVSSLSGAQQKAAFYTCWTRKEAYLKATGKGLAGLSEAAALENGLPSAGERWTVIDLTIPEPFYSGAVAFSGGPAKIEALLLRLDNTGI
ncbi:MAG: 4'-phosphopantetheinyl transferase superfamily protein, partial [Proteobacteria bacterium]|nr:4'-phosphopantetheinyl transferase superfamily protein [Pseudomonadota bacterium]